MAKHGEASDTGVRPRGRREVVCGIRRHVALALRTALLLRLPVFDPVGDMLSESTEGMHGED